MSDFTPYEIEQRLLCVADDLRKLPDLLNQKRYDAAVATDAYRRKRIKTLAIATGTIQERNNEADNATSELHWQMTVAEVEVKHVQDIFTSRREEKDALQTVSASMRTTYNTPLRGER